MNHEILFEKTLKKNTIHVKSKSETFAYNLNTNERGDIVEERNERDSLEGLFLFSSPDNFSPDTPIELFYDKETHLYSNSYIHYLSVYKFPDGNVKFTLILKTINYSCKTKTIFFDKKDAIYSLKMESNGRPQLTINNRLCYTKRSIRACYSYFQTILRSSSEHIEDFKNLMLQEHIPKDSFIYDIDQWYYSRRNLNLKDLPWTLDDLKGLYREGEEKRRRKVLYYLNKNDTKGAVKALLFGKEFPKSIKKRLYRIDTNYLIESFCINLETSLKAYGPNNINTVLDAIYYSDDPFGRFWYVIEFISLQLFSIKHVINTLTHTSFNGGSLIQDTLRLYQGVLTKPEINDLTIKDYHDLLSIAYHEQRNKDKEEIVLLYNQTDLSRPELDFSTEDFNVAVVKDANDLTSIAYNLNMCVSSYKRDFFLGLLDIAVVKDSEGFDVACIELVDNLIVQAKLKYNKRVNESKEVLDFVNQWCELKNLTPNTCDLGVSVTRYKNKEPLKERVEALNNVRPNRIKTRNNALGEFEDDNIPF